MRWKYRRKGRVTNHCSRRPKARTKTKKKLMIMYFLFLHRINQKSTRTTEPPGIFSPHQLCSLQLADPTLENWRSQADGDGWGELLERWGVVQETIWGWEGNLLVVPKCCRKEVFQLVHYFPMAGHYGETRTLDILRWRVVWPRMTMDVK